MESETKTLFPETVCHGVKIKPWGLSKMAKISPYVLTIIDELKKRGITVGEFESRIPEILLIAMPYMPQIVSISVEKTIAEIDEMSEDAQFELAKSIIEANSFYLKNSFRVPTVKAETPTNAGSPEPSSLS